MDGEEVCLRLENLKKREAYRRFPFLKLVMTHLVENHREVLCLDGGVLNRKVERETPRTGRIAVDFKIVTSRGMVDVPEGTKLREMVRATNGVTHAIQISRAKRPNQTREMIPVATVVVFAVV